MEKLVKGTLVKVIKPKNKYEHLPERIDDSPEQIARRVLRQKPKKNSRYLEKQGEENDGRHN